jgi:hypothetical protein
MKSRQQSFRCQQVKEQAAMQQVVFHAFWLEHDFSALQLAFGLERVE